MTAFTGIPDATSSGYALSTNSDADGVNAWLKKKLVGYAGVSGDEFVAEGHGSTVSIATAAALAACNGQRKVRYGAGATAGHGSIPGGSDMTIDVN